jgi:hypothetical protein
MGAPRLRFAADHIGRYLSICHEEGQKGHGRATDQRLLSDSFATTDLRPAVPDSEIRFYDCPALTTTTAATKANHRLFLAVLPVSVVLLAVLIAVVAAVGTTLLGVPTTYGAGIDSKLGAQIVHDFLADQQAEAIALSTGDQSVLGGRLTDSALTEVIQQINSQPATTARPRVTFQPSSLTILRAQDPADPSLTIQVREDGAKTVVTDNGPNAAPSEQTISFHGDFWLRAQSGSNYTIADQQIQILPSSPVTATALMLTALLLVGVTALLVIRQRTRRPALQLAPTSEPGAVSTSTRVPTDEEGYPASGSPAELVVTTFGGLHIRKGGSDWAQTLMSRPVTGFVWLRLLLSAIREPRSAVSREEVARQASPGLSRGVQLKRLRNVIAKGLPEMPAVLRDRIQVQPESMSFSLEGCEIDAIELLALSSETSGRQVLSNVESGRIQRLLTACQGTFLPDFETIEDMATDRHPTCTELIRELRELLTNKRVDLALLLGQSYLSAKQPASAVAVLEPAVNDRRERKDLADRLVDAYRAAGREAEAKALEARFA